MDKIKRGPYRKAPIWTDRRLQKFYLFLCDFYLKECRLPTHRETIDAGYYLSTSHVGYAMHRLTELDLLTETKSKKVRKYAIKGLVIQMPPSYEYFKRHLKMAEVLDDVAATEIPTPQEV